MRLLCLLLFTAISFPVHSQNCRVLDPELQGAYSGGCANGLAEGEGTAKGAAQYQGGFRQGMKYGKGVKTWKNGDRYEGGFVDDHREGFGTYTWGSGKWAGERYEGAYSNDRRHGFGIYRWPSGDVYTGPWQNDAPTGPATGMMLARKKFVEESREAVKEGVKVCREVAAGGAQEWVRGVVVAVKDELVGVRIDDAGKQGAFRKGETAWGEPTEWTPCL
jgi:hypothetical protein